MTGEKTLEQLLAEAEERARIAVALLDEWHALKARMLQEFPVDRWTHHTAAARRIQEDSRHTIIRVQEAKTLPIAIRNRIKSRDEALARKAVEDAKKQEARDAEEASRKYRDEAVNWLISRGKAYGQDFTAETAIETANYIAAEEETARRKADLQSRGAFTGFNGQNCDGPCDGWDGVSHRCQCGNRRVDWVTGDGNSFKRPHVYAEAY